MELIIESLKAIFIGIVEGITEWLPISSTGHMILVDEFINLQVTKDFLELFLVVIQIGAILAVILLFFHKLNPVSPTKTTAEKKATWKLWGMVLIGCLPAAVFGVALDDFFTEHFHNAWTVATALIVYGILFIVIEQHNKKKEIRLLSRTDMLGKHAKIEAGNDGDDAEQNLFRIHTVDEIDWKTALKIGFFQVLAIVPGTSRSGATIIGGMLSGCSRTAATEYTFFLAIPIMFGWGLLKSVKYFLSLTTPMTTTEILVLILGISTAFVVSVLSIKFLLGYIKKNDFTAFGIYRIVLGVIVLAYFGAQWLLA